MGIIPLDQKCAVLFAARSYAMRNPAKHVHLIQGYQEEWLRSVWNTKHVKRGRINGAHEMDLNYRSMSVHLR